MYELVSLPAWIGHVLLWDMGNTNRWLFVSGLVLMLASLVIWSNRLISLDPFRFFFFALLGPVASLVFKSAWLAGNPNNLHSGIFYHPDELLLCGLVFVASLAAWYIPLQRALPSLW